MKAELLSPVATPRPVPIHRTHARLSLTPVEWVALALIALVVSSMIFSVARAAVIRTQLTEGISLASVPARAVSHYYASQGRMPQSNEELGLTRLVGEYVKSVQVKAGVVVVTYGENVVDGMKGKSIELLPLADGQRIHWHCQSSDIAIKYLPSVCR